MTNDPSVTSPATPSVKADGVRKVGPSMRVRDIMSSPVVTVTVVTTVKHAAALLASNGFTALPVLDDDGRHRRHGWRTARACRDGGGSDDDPGDRHGCGHRCG